jgi:hypothetical protein
MEGRKRAAVPNAENNAENRSDQQTLQLRPAQPSAGNIYEGQSASRAVRRLPRQLIDVGEPGSLKQGKIRENIGLFCGTATTMRTIPVTSAPMPLITALVLQHGHATAASERPSPR